MGGACGRSYLRFMWEGLVGGALWETLIFEVHVGGTHMGGASVCGRN